MNLECDNCGQPFDTDRYRGYCDECVELWLKQRETIHKRQRPSPGVIADGKFANGSPASFTDPISGRQVCGLCGGDTDQGYGLGSGYGLGAYTFCVECYAFLDFVEDAE